MTMNDISRKMREMAQSQARAMRGQARQAAQKRKEEYLGARVPRELKEKVIAHADAMGIPVSILIRNILEETFKEADKQAGMAVAKAAKSGDQHGTKRKYPEVIAWERITLNRVMSCASCQKKMIQGEQGSLGIGLPGEGYVILCTDCRSM